MADFDGSIGMNGKDSPLLLGDWHDLYRVPFE
jgi:hypothetical protein